MYVCDQVPGVYGSPERALEALEQEPQMTVSLRSGPGAFGRAVSAPNHGAFPPAPCFSFPQFLHRTRLPEPRNPLQSRDSLVSTQKKGPFLKNSAALVTEDPATHCQFILKWLNTGTTVTSPICNSSLGFSMHGYC